MRRGLALVGVLLAGEARAARVALPLPELCARSEAVVVAEITGYEYQLNAQGLVETWSDLAILRVVHGRAPAGPARVVTPGGVVDGMRLSVSEAASLKVDHRYLLLLTPRPDGGFALTGGPDGAIPLGDEAAAVARLEGCRAR